MAKYFTNEIGTEVQWISNKLIWDELKRNYFFFKSILFIGRENFTNTKIAFQGTKSL